MKRSQYSLALGGGALGSRGMWALREGQAAAVADILGDA